MTQFCVRASAYNIWYRVSKINYQEITFDGMRFEVPMAVTIKLSSGMTSCSLVDRLMFWKKMLLTPSRKNVFRTGINSCRDRVA